MSAGISGFKYAGVAVRVNDGQDEPGDYPCGQKQAVFAMSNDDISIPHINWLFC